MIKQVIVGFWFKELKENPLLKVKELENEFKDYFNIPLYINDMDISGNIAFPRIISNGEFSFKMSLINFYMEFNINSMDKDEVVLLVNKYLQYTYSVLKDIYNIEGLYSSIKVIYEDYDINIKELKNNYNLKNPDLVDFVIKENNEYQKYYLNKTYSVFRKITIPLEGNVKEEDLYAKTMITSIDNSNYSEICNYEMEINDRLSFNKDPEYHITSDSLREIIFDFKQLISK